MSETNMIIYENVVIFMDFLCIFAVEYNFNLKISCFYECI